MERFKQAVGVLLFATVFGVSARADVVNIGPVKDNTLYEEVTGALSNGAGEYCFAGKTGALADGRLHRAVLAFDIAGSIPAGATITTATLTLNMSKTRPGSADMTLHRLTSDWGEGTSNAGAPGGDGAPTTAGDATWLHTFASSQFWTTPGGDFVGTVSATQSVGNVGFYSWTSGQLTADVQDMLDNPAGDFGWILRGDEVTDQSAKRFDTRENFTPGNRPVLTVVFDAPPVPAASEWGLLILAIVVLTGGTVMISWRGRAGVVRGC